FASYVPQDAANYPTFTADEETNDLKFIFTTEDGYLLDTEFYGWNLSSTFPDMAAIELIGYGEEYDPDEDMTYPYYEYLLLTTNGILYDMPVYYTAGALNYSALLDTGLRLSDPSDVSMAYVLDRDGEGEVRNEGVVLAVESAKQIWYLDFLDEYRVKLVGSFDFDRVDGLVGYLDRIGTEEGLAEASSSGSARADVHERPAGSAAATVAAERFACEDAAGTAETDNFLPDPTRNDLGAPERSSARYMPVLKGSTGSADDGEVTVTLAEDADTSNGVVIVEYDPRALEYVGASSDAALISVNASDGIATFAYASDAVIDAGETIGVLYFAYTDSYIDTEVTVYTDEIGPVSGLQSEGKIITILHEDGDHELEEISRVKASCTEDGLVTSKCAKCGGVFEEVIPATGHSVEDIAEVPPTCTLPGTTAGKKCSVCGEVFEGLEVIFPTGHDAVIDGATEPSCETAGHTAGTHCKNCGEVLIAQNEIPAKGHVWDEGVVTAEPTYDADGARVLTCSVCGKTATEVIPKLEHTPLPCGDDETCPGKIFRDMPARGDWAHDPIDWAVEYGITTGTSPNTFSPGHLVTRAQVVTFLWRVAGSPEPTGVGGRFADVKEGAYYFKPVTWAIEKGITNGITDRLFEPDGVCTRAQIVTFLYRYAGSPKVSVKNTWSDVVNGSFYEEAVLWAASAGITSGISATKFAPSDFCTRAQTVTFLYRLVNK
ncbi:MAG: S-layer homology domain-containing protein, partial [Clostridia bacterium]|nr:S-layer homology domain-containing protein [Clostridia bacterium]